MTTHELIEEFLKDGDSDKFDQLYNMYFKHIVRRLTFRTRNHHLSEDLAQDVFIVAYTEMSNGRYKYIEGRFPAWLWRIACNLHTNYTIDVGRRLSREKTSFMQEMANTTLGARIRVGMENMPQSSKEILSMKYIEGHSNAEIGYNIGVSETTAWRRIQSAVKLLREEVSE